MKTLSRLLTPTTGFLLIFAAGGMAEASFISGLGNPLTAIPGGTQITFDSFMVPPTTLPTTIDAVTFGQGDGATYTISNAYTGQYNTTGNSLQNTYVNGTQFFTFSFATPTSAFAFNWGASDDVWTLTAYNSSHGVIESDLMPVTTSSNAGQFNGISAPGISYVTLIDNPGVSNDYVFIDNFTYGASSSAVPEPSTIVLGSVAGLMGIAYGCRRRRKSATPKE